jgi:hypothetical protein
MFKSKSIVLYSVLGLATLGSGCALFKKKPAPVKAVAAVDPAKKTADSLKKAKALKPYGEIVTKTTKTQTGYFKVHQNDRKFYFEVPDSIMGRDILIVNRVSKASADMRNGNYGYAGDQIGESVYRFEKGPDRKLFLRRISFSEYSGDSTKTMFASVDKNNVQAIAQAWPIVSMPTDSNAVVVEVTDFLNSDNEIIYFERKQFKERAGMGAQQNDMSYVDYIHATQKNVEIRAVKTYAAGRNPTSSNYTVELNSSMALLPKVPMRPRLEDQRVGYFTKSFKDFDANPQGVATTTYITRWKMEPKPEDVEKYKRGELVEPAKKIVFYIDPVTPKKWVPYLIQGINDWNIAFEAAGFKNAIIGLEAPTKAQDSTWSIDDASHSAVIYRPSAIPNAMGPSVADPRSGEIIESHIFWYHNVMALLQRWYMMQAAAVDPGARKLPLDTELMGELIRFVSSHEVGHALGLRHNFGSSSTVPVEKLRDKQWVEKHGHTPSIMDYARFNYVAQPEDNISRAGIFPRIGDYDKWAIQWGYRWLPQYNSAEEENKAQVKVVSDSLKNNKRLWFGHEMQPFDPRSQNEDLGDNAMLAGAYGIKNLKRILPKMESWVTVPGENQEKLFKAYEGLWDQYSLYLRHVSKNISGEYVTPKVNGEAGKIIEPVPFALQRSAVNFLQTQIFDTPLWLNNKSLLSKTGINFALEVSALQETTINDIITRAKMSRMLTAEYENKNAYTLNAFFNDLERGIFREFRERKNVDFYRRNLQKLYLNRLLVQGFYNDMTMITPPGTYRFGVTDMNAILRDRIKSLQQSFRNALKNQGLDKMTRLHLESMISSIDQKFTAEKQGLNK